VRQLNFSSFGTQLETPAAAAVPPPPTVVGARRRSAMGPLHRPSRIQEGPTAIDPDLHAPNERDCQRKPTCRTRTCGNAVLRCPSRTPWTPRSPTRPAASAPPRCASSPSFPPSFHVDPPHVLPFLLLSPIPLTFLTERPHGSDSLILFFPFPPRHVSLDSRGSTRTTLKDPRGTSRE